MDFGINLVSAINLRWFILSRLSPKKAKRATQEIIWGMNRIGFNVMVLPVIGLTGHEANTPWHEDVWDPSLPDLGLVTSWRRGKRLDWMLFQRQAKGVRAETLKNLSVRSTRISHQFEQGAMTEVTKELGITLSQIVQECQLNPETKLVLDTRHLVELGDQLGMDEQELLEKIDLLRDNIYLLHLNPSEGVDRFMEDPESTLTWRLLMHLLQSPNRVQRIIVEYDPGLRAFLSPKEGLRKARGMYNIVNKIRVLTTKR